MSDQTYLEQISGRVDRLLQHHSELQQSHNALVQQVQSLTLERDALHARLQTAIQQLDALLAELPPVTGATAP